MTSGRLSYDQFLAAMDAAAQINRAGIILLPDQAAEILDLNALRASFSDPDVAFEWQFHANALRWHLGAQASPFTMSDGRRIADPRHLANLILDSEKLNDESSFHLKTEGSRWLIDNRMVRPDLPVMFQKILTTQLFEYAELHSDSVAKRYLGDALHLCNQILDLVDLEGEPELRSEFLSLRGSVLSRMAALRCGMDEQTAFRLAINDYDAAIIAAMSIQDKATRIDTSFLPRFNRAITVQLRGTRNLGPFGVRELHDVWDVCKEAVFRHSPTQDPYGHATAQMNLGNALLKLASWQDVAAANISLGEAIQCFRIALKTWTRDAYPMDCARALRNLGQAFSDIAEVNTEPKKRIWLRAALRAYKCSLSIRDLLMDPFGSSGARMELVGALLSAAKLPSVTCAFRLRSLDEARTSAKSLLGLADRETELPGWLLAQRRLASACHGLGDVAGARSALEAALEEGRRGILGSGDALARTLVAQRIAGAGDALALLRLRVDGDAAGALAALGLGRGVQMGADLVMARLEADPDLALQRDALRLLQAAREDLALADRELARLRGMAEGARRKIGAAVEAGNDEAAAEARDVLKLADDQLPTLEAERAAASAAFDTARAAHEAGLAEAGLTLDPVPPGWEAVAVALPEGGALAVPIVGEDAEGGALLILGRGPDGSPQAAWTEMPGLNEKATRSLLSGTMADAEDGATGHDTAGWLSAYSDLRRALTAAEGKARPHGPALLALDVAVRAMGRQLWDLLMGLLDRALRTFGLMPGAEVVLMPPGRLAALPLAAAHPAPETGDAPIRPFVTDWALSIVPSPQALVAAQARIDRLARLDAPVANAGDDAPGHRLLCVATPAEFAPNPVADLVSPEMRQEIEGADATPEAVRNALPGYRFAAFLCHGHWEPQDPGRSGLQLAGPPDEAGRETHAMLTLGDLQRPGVAAGDARSWLLMACETAPVGLDAPDEFAGLAVRLAGEVPAVTGTLYPVLLCHAEKMGRAVLALQIGPQRLSPAQALRQAQLTALHSGRAGLEALVAEAIAPQPATPDRAPPPPRRPAPGPSPALGLPNRTLFTGEHDDQTSDPEDSPSPENHDPDNRDTYLLAHWAAFATYGR